MVLFLERFAGQLHGFGDGRSGDRSPPLPNDFVPVHSLSHLLEHLGNPYAGTPKGWLTVADFWIGHDVLAESFLPHFVSPQNSLVHYKPGLQAWSEQLGTMASSIAHGTILGGLT